MVDSEMMSRVVRRSINSARSSFLFEEQDLLHLGNEQVLKQNYGYSASNLCMTMELQLLEKKVDDSNHFTKANCLLCCHK